jgi:methylenetetrahydrofolate dehydrogenase (NADP+)/methenyltetrahydrofolate cyclohydrolase
MLINCLQLRDEIAEKIKEDITALKSHGIIPSFAIIQVGNYPPSDTYVHVKMRKAKELGIDVKIFKFQNSNVIPAKAGILIRIRKLIDQLNKDPSIHGIIIQRPLPPTMDETHLQSLINPSKDIDGLSPNSPFINPLIQAVVRVISYVFSQPSFSIHLRTTNYLLRTAVVGKGGTAGKPIYNYFSSQPVISTAGILLNVKQIDSSTKNPDEILKKADIIISCVGKPNILRHDNIKKDVVLISVGQHQEKIPTTNVIANAVKQSSKQIAASPRLDGAPRNDKLHWIGDYDESEIADLASFYTPTPYGIGPLNVIFLLKNVIKATK